MINRLHSVLSGLEQLSPEAQEEAATYIEALVEALKLASMILSHTRDESGQGATDVQWQDLFRSVE
jgi:hypothetical protein